MFVQPEVVSGERADDSVRSERTRWAEVDPAGDESNLV